MSRIHRLTVTCRSSCVTSNSDSRELVLADAGGVHELLVGQVHQVVQHELVVALRRRWSRRPRPSRVSPSGACPARCRGRPGPGRRARPRRSGAAPRPGTTGTVALGLIVFWAGIAVHRPGAVVAQPVVGALQLVPEDLALGQRRQPVPAGVGQRRDPAVGGAPQRQRSAGDGARQRLPSRSPRGPRRRRTRRCSGWAKSLLRRPSALASACGDRRVQSGSVILTPYGDRYCCVTHTYPDRDWLGSRNLRRWSDVAAIRAAGAAQLAPDDRLRPRPSTSASRWPTCGTPRTPRSTRS